MLPPRRLAAAARLLAATLLGVLALAAPLAAETLRPAGAARAVDRPGDCASREPSLAALAGGGFVAAWIDGATLWWRRLDSTGLPLGEPAELATGAELADPEVVARLDGGFAVVWFDGGADRVRIRSASLAGTPGAVLDVGVVEPGAAQFAGLDAAVAPSGNVAIAWTSDVYLTLRELRPDGTWVGEPAQLLPEQVLLPPPAQHAYLSDPAVVGAPDGSTLLFFVAAFGPSQEEGNLTGLRVGPAAAGGVYPPPTSVPVPATGLDKEPVVVAARQGGGFLLAWAGDHSTTLPILPIPLPVVLAARYDAAGLTGPDAEVVDASMHRYTHVAATAAADGRFVVGWSGTFASDSERPFGVAATLDAAGRLEGAAVTLGDAASWGQAHPELAAGAGGLLLSAWQEVSDPDIVYVTCPGERIRARAFQLTCGEDGTLCVGGGRFALSLTFFDPRRGVPRQEASGAALTADTGYFWFTAPDNVEVVVKVLDGRGLNGHFWVFYGGLTDLGFELTVRDNVTGRERTFINPPGTLASRGVVDALLPSAAGGAAAEVADVRAFASTALVRDAFPASRAPGVDALTPPPPPTPCQDPSRPGLCLNGERFGVSVTWRAFDGTTGAGHGVELGDDSGYFWFFHPDNVELVVKVLDGRPVNGKFWVFYGALSNVEYTIDVRHVIDDWGQWLIYENPLGRFASVADIDAFEPPGASCVCPAVVAPVCGKDGRTYGNDCEAYCVGWVAIAHDGPCEEGP